MKDIFFIFRVLMLTVTAILIFQVKVGETTLEQKSEAWIRSSTLVTPLQEVADGTVVVIHKLIKKAEAFLASRVGSTVKAAATEVVDDNQPGRRQLKMHLERSKDFLKEKAGKAKDIIEQGIESAQEEYVEDELPLEEE